MNLPPLPYRCLPAPYERALFIGEFLKSRKIKGRLIILDPGAGLLAFSRRFAEDYRDQIVYLPHTPVRSVDPFAKMVYSDVEDYRFDEAILMLPQQGGELAWQADLIAPGGWADQHPLRLHARSDERVFLVGDLIGKVSPLFGHYTKTGHLAARLGPIAAMEIAARSRGIETPVVLPDSLCLVDTSLNPPENIRIEANYRQRGDGLVMQTIRQQRDPQPRGEEQAWAQGLLTELFGSTIATEQVR